MALGCGFAIPPTHLHYAAHQPALNIAGRNTSAHGFCDSKGYQCSSVAPVFKAVGSPSQRENHVHVATPRFSCSSPSTEPSSPSASSQTSEPAQRDVVIRPRRKGGKQEDKCEPVTITIEMLESLYCKPLITAAKTIGISITAFKKVCRNLGIRNWPYRFQDVYQRPVRAAQEAAQAPTIKKAEEEDDELEQEQEQDDTDEIATALSVEDGTEWRTLLEHSKEVWGNPQGCKSAEEPGEAGEGWLVCPLDASRDACDGLGWAFDISAVH